MDPRTQKPSHFYVEYFVPPKDEDDKGRWVRGSSANNLWEAESSRKFFTAPTRLTAAFEVVVVLSPEDIEKYKQSVVMG